MTEWSVFRLWLLLKLKALIVRLKETQQIGKRYFSSLVLTSRLIINPSCRLALGLVDVDSHILSTFHQPGGTYNEKYYEFER